MTTRSVSKAKPARKAVPLVVRVEGARAVAVTGDFTHWSSAGVPLSRNRDGDWEVRLELPPGEHQYRLLVDGEWRDDPAATRLVPNPFGTNNCVLRVNQP